MSRNPTFCSFVLFSIVSLTIFINKAVYSKDKTIFMISFISSFIISVFIPDQKTSLWIAASVTNAGAFNPNGIKTLLANGLSIIFIKDKPVFSNNPKNLSLPVNPLDCPILCDWVLDNFILADELLIKALQSDGTCLLFHNDYVENYTLN